MSNPHDYTVGWLCAIGTEYIAACAFLDKEHDQVEFVSPHDENIYTLGEVGKHNVVIATFPYGEYGIAVAASVAGDMLNSFPNIRFALMVGIGGGSPNEMHDIRLGDVVVSAPCDGKGGVLQYDFGKTIQDQEFHMTGFLNQPPRLLRAAMKGLKAKYTQQGHQLNGAIRNVLETRPKLRKEYERPDQNSDRLYRSGFVHSSDDNLGCAAICGQDPSILIVRPQRTEDEDNPVIHYGLIASANQLMKDALVRDKLAANHNVLCFEMEAAGLMNRFPCLVIRGICDYSDSHKNKKWQGYAAMTAAAYAKDLLRQIAPNEIKSEKKLGDVLSGLHEVAQQSLCVAKQHRKVTEVHVGIAKARLSKEEQEEIQKCHQLFRLTDGSRDATYEWYKDRVEDRVKDTCLWFLYHEHFQKWSKQEFGPLLVTADPGCGKSVLAKYLIDHGLPRSATICYFFFKDQDQNTARQALCALLHQLFSQKPALIKHAITQFRRDGESLINSTESLWKVLRSALKDTQAGPVIMVLDALDECAEVDFASLMRIVQSQFRSDQAGNGLVKYLLTSRPYEQIVSEFHDLLSSFPNIRIPGEEESEAISQEVNYVITHRVNQLSDKKRLSDQVKFRLLDRLLKITHRTYLWAYLVFDQLNTKDFKKTPRGVESAIATLPETVNDAYEQILNRSNKPLLARKALGIILAANRPLTLSEMNVAVHINCESQSIDDLDLEDDEDFKCRLRSWCGLFVSVYHGKVYFLHQTAREFLLADIAFPTTIASELRWHHSINTRQAHAVLAELCVLYLNFFNSGDGLPIHANGEDRQSVDSHAFLDYSAKTWGSHFREADIMDNATIMSYALRISDPNSKSYAAWFGIYWRTTRTDATEFTNLLVASYFGHRGIVNQLLEKSADVEVTDSKYGQTPLSWAARKGHEAVVQLLLKKGVDVEAKDSEYGQTPLSWAARKGHEGVAHLLLETGANAEAKDSEYGQTPLSWAARKGHEGVAHLLLETGANAEAKDSKHGQTPLSWAAQNGHEAVVQLLLKKGADVEAKDSEYGQSPLSWAARGGHEAVVMLLLEQGANIEAKDNLGQTPLLCAAWDGYEAVIKLLLEEGANIEAEDNFGQTALLWAAWDGHEAVVKLLLEKGADIETKDNLGQTPLSRAAWNGHEAIVKLLLEEGINIDAEDNFGQTALSRAAEMGHDTMVRLLLDEGADIEAEDNFDRTALLWAAEMGHEAVVKLLLNEAANIEAEDNYGRTALLWAAEMGHEAVVKLLLNEAANIEAEDNYGRTALSWAAWHGHEAVVILLLDEGADIEAEDNFDRTALLWAAEMGHEAVVKLLLNEAANIEAEDNYGQTALSRAAWHGHEEVVKLLLEEGADIEAERSEYGPTLLSWAARKGYETLSQLVQTKYR